MSTKDIYIKNLKYTQREIDNREIGDCEYPQTQAKESGSIRNSADTFFREAEAVRSFRIGFSNAHPTRPRMCVRILRLDWYDPNLSLEHNIQCLITDLFDIKTNKEAHKYIKSRAKQFLQSLYNMSHLI